MDEPRDDPTGGGGPHAGRAAIGRYVRGELSRPEGRAIERHLVGCLACQAAVAAAGDRAADSVRWRGHRFARGGAASAVRREGDDRLRGVLRGLAAATDAFGAALWKELLAASEHRRRALVAGDPRFASLPLAERLARSCRAAWLDDPLAAVELARLAAAVASRLDPGLYGERQVADARALAFAHLGNSYRVAARGGGDAAVSGAKGVAEGTGEAPIDPGEGAGDAYPAGGVPASWIGEPAGGPAGSAGAGWSPALAALAETLDACLERRMPFEAALVAIDLAAAHLRRGRPGDAAASLAGAAPLLAAAGLAGESLSRFRALAAGALDAERLAAAAAELGRARNDPAARFGEGGER